MPVIAIVNRKGGSGKSTLATHIAAWLARQGLSVVLGDIDRQQSSQTWLRRRQRQQSLPPMRLGGWSVDPRSVVRPPAGSNHLVLDTPGGLRGFDLARVVMYADAILMPVCNSAFDRESAADCLAELRTLPRIASGRCRLAAIGMRIDARTRAEAVLRDWATPLALPFIGVLRDTQVYVRSIDDGLSVFDLPPAKAAQDLAQWQPIVEWLTAVMQPAPADAVEPAARAQVEAPRGPSVAAQATQEAPSQHAAQVPAWLRRDAGVADLGRDQAVPASASAAVLDRPRQAAVAAPRTGRPLPALRPHAALPGRSESAAAGDAPSASVGEASAAARRPLAGHAGHKGGSGRIGRLLGALALPRFLQRNS